jgi:hypothetical protein
MNIPTTTTPASRPRSKEGKEEFYFQTRLPRPRTGVFFFDPRWLLSHDRAFGSVGSSGRFERKLAWGAKTPAAAQ